MKITLDIPNDDVADYVGRARIDYWAECVAWNPKTLTLKIKEHEPDDKGDGTLYLGRDSFVTGLVVLATKYPKHFADLVGDTGDAYTGDLLIQCAAFGEEKYA